MTKSKTLPFILQFAQNIGRDKVLPCRYNQTKQIMEVLIKGRWIPSVDAPVNECGDGTTRITRVLAETSDDE